MEVICPKCKNTIQYRGNESIMCQSCQTWFEIHLDIQQKHDILWREESIEKSTKKESSAAESKQKKAMLPPILSAKVDYFDGDLHKWANWMVFFSILLSAVLCLALIVGCIVLAKEIGGYAILCFLLGMIIIAVLLFFSFLASAKLDAVASMDANLQLIAEQVKAQNSQEKSCKDTVQKLRNS